MREVTQMNLKQRREQLGLTVIQMADKLNLDPSNLSKYELGKRVFRTIDLLAVIEHYNLTFEELKEYLDEVARNNNKNKERDGNGE